MSLLSPLQVKKKLPLTTEQQRFIEEQREVMNRLVTGVDGRFALILGPCSIHDLPSALKYGNQLKVLSQEVFQDSVCVMRVYVEKARTVVGWKGFIHDPYLDGSNDIQSGIFLVRELFLMLTDLGIPLATEIVNPLFLPYFEDLISWGFIGARTSASPLHREIASGVPFSIGFKNSLDGNIEQAVCAMKAASASHHFPYLHEDGFLTVKKSEGNPYTHVVLRGSWFGLNYDTESFEKTCKLMRLQKLNNRLLIDCSHGNSQGEYRKQKDVFQIILNQFKQGNKKILGVMLESHLEEGGQELSSDPSSLKYAVSVTDPCIGWSETERLVRSVSD